MLKIRYIPQLQQAELSTEAPTPAWTAIRRTCEDRTTEVNNISGSALTMPWWAFLSCRSALGVILAQHELRVSFENGARELMEAALAREQSYAGAKAATPLDPETLLDRLQAAGFKRTLTDHQVRNVCAMAGLPAAATFSVPGAGKTTEALAYYFLRATPKTQLLVVAPKNAFAAWEEQLALCAQDVKQPFVRLQGGSFAIGKKLATAPRLTLITYHQIPTVVDAIARHLASAPTFMFLDESHRMKRGHEGVIGKEILNLSHLPSNKLILSGTPLPNSLVDLVPQFDFLYPEVRATESDVKDLVQPIYVRTTKQELGLPPLTRHHVRVPMSPGQQRLYQLLKSEEAREHAEIQSADRIALRRIGRSVMRLLQLTSNPALLAQSGFQYPELMAEILTEGGSPKMEYVCNRARHLARQGRKTVIWSSFVDNVELIANRLSDIGAVYIHGGVEAGSEADEETREARILKFHNDPATKVLVGNPAACGEGISLHKICHNALYLDRNYNAAQYWQSEDRIHRLGLEPGTETRVEIVYCPGSIDESVDRRLVDKTNQMARVLNDRSLNIEPVTVDPEDLSMSDKDVDDFLAHLKE